ncbi:MAG: TrkA family potassium uptake protein [Candidatus Hinthialibacter antarcticus]|nr:TrkA family potassium uptake protein [Candidatus Hinthialibacter antarcticus]
MAKRMQIGIIGLGKFGLALGRSLIELGNEVVGIDFETSHVKNAQDILTQVYQADATDPAALKQLDIASLDYVIIGVGQNLEASALIALHLKELGAKNVWVKAISEDHEKILYRIGVDYVVFPERAAAEELAHRLTIPGFIDLLPYWKGVVIHELIVAAWKGQTLREIDMTNQYEVQCVAIRPLGGDALDFVPKADRKLNEGDVLVIIGREEAIAKITS